MRRNSVIISTAVSEIQVLQACRALFGREVGVDFLRSLSAGGVKSAYRKKAKQVHPDLYVRESALVQRQQNAKFRELTEAFKTLTDFLKEGAGPKRPAQPARPQTRTQPRPASRSGGASARANTTEFFYRGSTPARVLEIGQYLYYKGLIPFRALVDATIWQRKQRPVIGSIAKDWGWLKEQDLSRVINFKRPFARFGEKAVALGVLNDFQVRTLLYSQRTRQQQFGQFFVQAGLLSAAQMERLVQECRAHNQRCAAGVA